jgi:hypothetical protein
MAQQAHLVDTASRPRAQLASSRSFMAQPASARPACPRIVWPGPTSLNRVRPAQQPVSRPRPSWSTQQQGDRPAQPVFSVVALAHLAHAAAWPYKRVRLGFVTLTAPSTSRAASQGVRRRRSSPVCTAGAPASRRVRRSGAGSAALPPSFYHRRSSLAQIEGGGRANRRRPTIVGAVPGTDQGRWPPQAPESRSPSTISGRRSPLFAPVLVEAKRGARLHLSAGAWREWPGRHRRRRRSVIMSVG